MKKLLSVLIAILTIVCCFAVPTFAEEAPERTLTVIEATKDYVKFSYTGAVEGDNSWVGVYDAYAEISPEHHEEISIYYIYLAPGDGEYTLEYAKAGRVGEVEADSNPGTMLKNTNDNALLGDLSDYKIIWLGGESWYENFCEAPLVEEADTTAPAATDSSADNTSKLDDTSKPADTTGSTSGENNDGWVLPVVIVAAVVIVVAVVVIIVKKNKK